MRSDSEPRGIPRWWALVAISVIMAFLQFGTDTLNHLFQTPAQRRAEQAREKRQREVAEAMKRMPQDSQRTYDDIEKANDLLKSP